MCKQVSIFFCFLLLTIAALGQSSMQLKGRITDSYDGLPLVNAEVKLYTAIDTLVIHTNNDGFFSFSVQPISKAVRLVVVYLGYKEYRYTITSIADELLSIALELDSEVLNEGRVVARSNSLVRTIETGKVSISTDKLSQIPSALGVPDVVKVLQLMPGVQNSGEANGYLYVRGADPGHNLMLYDDAPVYGTSHLLGLFPFYNTDHISTVFFDKQNTNARFGNRLSATLQAISPDEIPKQLAVKGNIGLVASQLSIDVPVSSKIGLIVSGRQTYIDQVLIPILNAASSGKNDDKEEISYNFSDANITLLAQPNAKHKLSVNAFLSGDRFKITENEMLLSGRMRWGNSTASASWQWTPNSDVSFKQSVYFSQFSNTLKVGQASVDVNVESKVVDIGANSALTFEILKVPVEVGLQLSRYNVQPQKIVSSQLVWSDNTAAVDNTVNAWQIAAYVQAQPRITHSLYFDIGLRANSYFAMGKNENTFIGIEPKASLNYAPSARFSAYVAYAHKQQYLNLVTTSSVGFPTDFWIAANGSIPRQTANSYSVGSVYKPINGLEVNAGLFYNQLSNMIEYPYSILQFNEISSFGDDIYVGKGSAYGAELLVRKTGRLSGWISYTISKSDRKFSKINDGQTYPAKFDRRHNLSLVAHYKISQRWSVGLTQVYSTGSRFTVPTSWYFINNNPVKEYDLYNNAKMPDYVRTDIAIDYSLSKNVKRESILSFSIYNMFAVSNPFYIILDVKSNDSKDEIKTRTRYRRLYTILPSISWRFKF